MTRVLLIVPAHDEYLDALRAKFPDVRFAGGARPEDVQEQLAGAEILITAGQTADGPFFTPELLARLPRLAWVQSIAAGYDQLLPPLETRPDVLLTSGVGIHGPQMSEVVIFYMLGLTRDVKQLVRNQDAHVWQGPQARILDGLTVGIVGLGASGTRIARVCKAFGMTTYGLARTRRLEHEVDRFFEAPRLLELAAAVDFLVLTVPLSEETEKLVDAGVLAAMKPTAYLINVARGGVVDEAALIDALRRGVIAGAGLDVFEQLPLPSDSPLWDLDNVYVTPRVAGFHTRYTQQILTIIEPNLRHYLRGELDLMVNVVKPGGGRRAVDTDSA